MSSGACAQREAYDDIFICFPNENDANTRKRCHRAIGPLETFSKLSESTYDHRSIRIAVTSGRQHQRPHCNINQA